mmetsp:Transcript_10042/g.29717  ORF Transcript_10042/g.29717 Transcript_10042/m.29717 type:complete len:229 (+) Transcript_10042:190-876(+)
MPAKTPPWLMSSVGEPTSATLPSSSTTIRSASMMVLMRCAMMTHVASWKPSASRSVRWITESVLKSTAAVASSSSTILRRRSSARARLSSWRWPWDRFAPPVSISESRVSGCCCDSCSTVPVRFTMRSASLISSSLYWWKGSMLKRMEPEKMCGSWGMTARLRRSSCRDTRWWSTLSMYTWPPSISFSRARLSSREDLPEPVRPQMPTLMPAGMSMLMPLSTVGRSCR